MKSSLSINMEKGLIHIYTGGGKGKTTAAVGLSLRCCRRGYKVGFTSFLKDFESGELLGDCPFTVLRQPPFKGFWKDLTNKEKEDTRKRYSEFLSEIFCIAEKENYDLIVLDEVLVATSLGAVDTAFLIEILKNKPRSLEVVMTGANCPEELFPLADYISEIKCIKHPYNKGVGARDGIEK